MFKDKFVFANKSKNQMTDPENKPSKRNLSSKEFIEQYDRIWQKGPHVKYQNPDAWNRPAN